MLSVIRFYGVLGAIAVLAVSGLCVTLAIPPLRSVRSGVSGRALNPVLGQVARLEAAAALGFAGMSILITVLSSLGLDKGFG
jgi:hypothetical protein